MSRGELHLVSNAIVHLSGSRGVGEGRGGGRMSCHNCISIRKKKKKLKKVKEDNEIEETVSASKTFRSYILINGRMVQ